MVYILLVVLFEWSFCWNLFKRSLKYLKVYFVADAYGVYQWLCSRCIRCISVIKIADCSGWLKARHHRCWVGWGMRRRNTSYIGQLRGWELKMNLVYILSDTEHLWWKVDVIFYGSSISGTKIYNCQKYVYSVKKILLPSTDFTWRGAEWHCLSI